MHLAIYYKHQNGIPAEIKVMKPDYLALVEQEYDITCVEKLIAETGVLIPATAPIWFIYQQPAVIARAGNKEINLLQGNVRRLILFIFWG